MMVLEQCNINKEWWSRGSTTITKWWCWNKIVIAIGTMLKQSCINKEQCHWNIITTTKSGEGKEKNSKLQYSKTQILMEGRIRNLKLKTSWMQGGAQAHVGLVLFSWKLCLCKIVVESYWMPPKISPWIP